MDSGEVGRDEPVCCKKMLQLIKEPVQTMTDQVFEIVYVI